MRRELRRIFDEVSSGRLSQQAALEKIRALRGEESERGAGTLLATPVWDACALESAQDGSPVEYAERHVILCELPAADPAALESRLGGAHCLSLRADPSRDIAARYTEHALSCFERIQAILLARPRGAVLVQLVVPDHEEQALLAGLSGLLRTAAWESGQFFGQLVCVTPEITTAELSALLEQERAHSPAPLVQYAAAGRSVRRWSELPFEPSTAPRALRDNGVYLIAGGAGALGLLFAREILERTDQAGVVLAGRSALGAEDLSRIEALSARAGRVAYRQVDVVDPDQVRRLLDDVQDERGPLAGVLNCAGTAVDGLIVRKTRDEFRRVLAAKVDGTFNLDRASCGVDLDVFVLFSSVAGAIGNVGQADYASANGFLDHFAAYRNRRVAAGERRGRTRSINWGLWQAGGIGLDPSREQRLLESTGMRPMATATGLRAFQLSLALPHDQILVADGDLGALRRTVHVGRAAPAEPPPPMAEPAPAAPALDTDDLFARTQDYLLRECSTLLKMPPQKIDPHAALEQYGIDSILAMKLTSHLEATFGPLARTLFFEYQTIGELARYFADAHAARLMELFAPAPRSAERPEPAPRPRTGRLPERARRARPAPVSTVAAERVAVIGLSGRYPEAPTVEAFWDNLREGRDCVVEVPRERWDWREWFSEDRSQGGRHYSKWGGFISGVDEFDPLFFNISPREAKQIDPQERLFLEHAWMAVEDAGYTREGLQAAGGPDLPGQVGVYVGVMYLEYQLFGVEAGARGRRLGLPGSAASIANRVSYFLNVHGPSLALDTMCSSSLTAIHLACQDLILGRTSLAIAGGVNVSIHPNKYLVLSTGQFISSDGRCQSFGEGGDGYIPAEGVGAVVLKRLSDAERDGDHIYGVIRGSAVNHGGKTNGYSVPNPHAQAGVIRRALLESGTDARQVSYLEAHGTGTRLGDPIEIAALSRAFQHDTREVGFCALGSVKSNIGHCESAAGVAGLTKVLLQMQHGQLVPSLHSEQLNPHIDFAATPFIVNQALRPWERPVIGGQALPRIAGVSSFGAGGSNAHLIVEEYQPPERPPIAMEKVAVLLSARTPEQLQQRVRALLGFVESRRGALDLVALAYTLQVGREAMEERLGLVVDSVDQLIEKLTACAAGRQDVEDAYFGATKRNKEALSVFGADADLQQTVDKWIAGGRLSRLADLWSKGLDVDWTKLYAEPRPARLSLPTYPFARERYWVDPLPDVAPATRAASGAVLHPLVHANTSDLGQQSYSATFSGEEFFLKDHDVDGQRSLPAVACLEMARAAVQHAAHPAQETCIELKDVAWAGPLVVGQGQRLAIALSPEGPASIAYEIYSPSAGGEWVHGQGRAVVGPRAAPAPLDLGALERRMDAGTLEPDGIRAAWERAGFVRGPALRSVTTARRGSGEVLARLRLPQAVHDTAGEYVLHPTLLDGALQACVALIDDRSDPRCDLRSPATLDTLRVVSPCCPEMVAWVRHAPGRPAADGGLELDVDLCDERGAVCVQMRGVRWAPALPASDEGLGEASETRVVAPTSVPPAPTARRRQPIPLSADALARAPVARKKPSAVMLAELGGPGPDVGLMADRGPILLSDAAFGATPTPIAPVVRLYDDGGGVFSIHVEGPTPERDVTPELARALATAREQGALKVLLIEGLERGFGRGGREAHNAAVAQDLYRALATFPYPVIAALRGDTLGPAFMAAALCDLMVCGAEASYGYADSPTTAEAALLSERFGSVGACDLLYPSTTRTGAELRERGWTCPVLPAAEVGARAEQLAATLSAKPRQALGLLKQHLARHLVRLAAALTPVDADAPSAEDAATDEPKPREWPVQRLALETPVERVLLVRLPRTQEPSDGPALIGELAQVLASGAATRAHRVVVLASDHPDFLPASCQPALLELRRLLLEAELPLVAALTGNASAETWVVSQLCDACVYSDTGVYSAAGLDVGDALTPTAAAVFAHRFGRAVAEEILLSGADYSGDELQRRVGALSVVPRDEVLPAAVRLAASWAQRPRATLAAWRRHTLEQLRDAGRTGVSACEPCDDMPASGLEPTRIALRSPVVSAVAHPDGVVVVKMEDRAAKNMSSEALSAGLQEAFASIQQLATCKVVVLTGYDGYFASGGSQESLLAIQQGRATFTDTRIFQLPLDCRLPVIAAMQGHAIGAGWTLGLFADLAVLSEESRYVSPYMEYGFTPGAGATHVLADAVGQDLARESLFTAEAYAGGELKRRGARLPVLPRTEVYPAALALARRIARAPRARLMALKAQFAARVREGLEETYRLELAMHEQTLVGRADTLEQIQRSFDRVLETPSVRVPPAAESAPPPPAAAAAEGAGEDLSAVIATLKMLLAGELQVRESDIDDQTPFVDLGLDSITGVTWVRKINERYGASIDATRVYSHSTLAQLGRYVKAEADKLRPPSPASVPAEVPATTQASRSAPRRLASRRGRAASRFAVGGVAADLPPAPIAVIGMAGQFPQAANLDEFWRNIAQGRDCISEVPGQRWDLRAHYQPGDVVPGKTNSRWLGALRDYDRFDPLFFNISPAEAESMDPQQRVFLQACWHGIEDAGYDARALSGSRCGVFVGCATSDYHQASRERQLSAHGFTGSATSILAARISYFLDLHGPCVALDTACSSSLVAIAQACDSLNSGGSDVALAGGVYVMAGPEMHIRTAQAGMLSPQGRCFTFDQRADGFVPGEGVGVVMLKRLADAERDGDAIHGVIRGWGVNQDGRTNGITAPNPESQARLEQEVYDKYRIDPAAIQLVEAHGTGTKLGDPIEVEGLKQAFRKYTTNKAYCAIGSVKSNIGHCLTAAGIAGFIKLLLALEHAQQPPTINFERLNEHIDLGDSPFYVNSRLQEWRSVGEAGRLAAISSFGFSGTNAHLVVGEHRPPAVVELPEPRATRDARAIVPLSARTVEQLREKARDLADFVRRQPATDLRAIAYTLQVGRVALEERVGFVVDSVEQLASRLEAFANGAPGLEDSWRGQVRRGNDALSLFGADADLQATIDRWIANRKLPKLAELWAKGLELDWRKLYGEVTPARVRLPLYPFARDRYWISTTARDGRADTPSWLAPARALHPLVHVNTSDLRAQRYTSIFTGEEFFLVEQRVEGEPGGGHKVLPGVALLEMARAAVERARPAGAGATAWELRGVVWGAPVVVGGSQPIDITLFPDDDGSIACEIATGPAEETTVLGQVRVVPLLQPPPPASSSPASRGARMGPGPAPDAMYAAWGRAGLDFGPALRPLTAVEVGDGQVVASLRLPDSVAGTATDYVLHPTMLAGALQAALWLLDPDAGSGRARVPAALETLYVVSPCTEAMTAWVRRSALAPTSDGTARLDVDLSDERGNLCVRMQGLSLAAASVAVAQPDRDVAALLAAPTWHTRAIDVSSMGGREPADHRVILCEAPNIDARRLESLLPRGRCHGLPSDPRADAARLYTEHATACFELIRELFESQPDDAVFLQIVVADREPQALLAGLSALLRTAALENPRVHGQLVLAAPELATDELARRLRDELGGGIEPVVRLGPGLRQVPRFEEIAEAGEAPIAFRDRGVYLITGGLGGLGTLFARDIVASTRDATVILTGRSELGAEAQLRLDGLGAPAGRVRYRPLDLGDFEAVQRLVAEITTERGRLDGVLHCAGTRADNLILRKTPAEFRAVLAPKVAGAFHLDLATQDVPLDFFVLFSSIAAVVGNPGQADYAAANGFMDQLAAQRNRQAAAGRRHGRACSINWSLWQHGRMALDRANEELVQQAAGVRPMSTARGLRAFHRSLALPHDQVLVVECQREKTQPFLEAARVFEPHHEPQDPLHADAGAHDEAAVSLSGVQHELREMLGAVLRIDAAAIALDRPFSELGLDSFLGAELVVAVNKKYGTGLTHVRLFDYSTIDELSRHLEQELRATAARSARRAAPAARAAGPSPRPLPPIERAGRVASRATGGRPGGNDRVTIIGMSGRYPQAADLDEYWSHLAAGRNCIGEVPASRWDVGRYYDPDRTRPGKTYSKWLGAVDDVECFDPLFFRLSPQEAEHIDPQHRLFLQESYRAFEDAGYASPALSRSRCGVYLGISTNEYMALLAQRGVVAPPVTGNSYAIAAARIAYHLNLKGPAISVDTACSSSLVAVHLACQALLQGDIDMALAGGVSLWLVPDSYIAMSKAGMFSPGGQCRAFDDGADGIVNGDGVGVVVLKRLSEAERDGDDIRGVILGSGINQDGRTNGITAPSVNSQIELERAVYARHGIHPESISCVEAHGTGTRLGDPIELEALATVFKEQTSKKGFCALGSVKSNIGHTTAAAGVAGLHKVLLSMRHRTLVPSLNVTRENSRFDFGNSPFYVSRQTRPWETPAGSPRRAAISSFGFSGTNAHLVVEEYASPRGAAPTHPLDGPALIVLSARTPEALRQRARDLLEYVRAHGEADLASVAFTLQTGREAMEERMGFLAESIEELLHKLSAYVDGVRGVPGLHQGRVEPGQDGMAIIAQDDDMQDAISRWVARRKYATLLETWTRGLSIDWSRLYGDVKPPRLSLPAYPFARERCWVDGPGGDAGGDFAPVPEASLASIEDIIDRIDEDSADVSQAVQALKMLV